MAALEIFTIGNSTKALEAYKASAEIRETHNLPVRELAQSYYNIANVHLERNEYSQALTYLEKSSVIYSEMADSSGLASVYITMADNISDQGDFNAAMDYLKDALRIRKNEYGENHQRVASVYVSMSGILRRLGKYDESALCIEKAYDIFVRIFGEKHPNVASTYLSMGQLAMDTEEYGAVQDYYEKAIGIFESFYNGLHPDIAHAYNELGRYCGTVRSDYSSAIRWISTGHISIILKRRMTVKWSRLSARRRSSVTASGRSSRDLVMTASPGTTRRCIEYINRCITRSAAN